MKRFFKSAALAWTGITTAVKTERHMKIHFAAAAIVIVLAALFRFEAIEWLLLIILIALVIGSELINTAIENAVDLASSEQHPLAKNAKDIAAGAVLFFVFTAVIGGIILFIPHILHFLK